MGNSLIIYFEWLVLLHRSLLDCKLELDTVFSTTFPSFLTRRVPRI